MTLYTPSIFLLYVRFQNLCKKAKMQKKAESACLISKTMQKRQKCKQKRTKMHVRFENSCKKG